MPDTRVEDETLGAALTGSEVFYMVQGGGPRKSTSDMLAALTANPPTSDGRALGNAALQWSDLFLANGAVINFGGGNYLITHAGSSLTFNNLVNITTPAGNYFLKLVATGGSTDVWGVTILASPVGTFALDEVGVASWLKIAKTTGVVTHPSTTAASSPTTGSGVFGGGIGVAGAGYFGGIINSPSLVLPTATAAAASIVANGNTLSAANGSNVVIPTGGSNLLLITDESATGSTAIWLIDGSNAVLVSQVGALWVASTTTPGAGLCSVAYSGGTPRIYNNRGGTTNFGLLIVRT